jgi:Zn-dependent protease
MEQLLTKISIMLVPALLAVTLHEVAHGYAAERCGDPTARQLGRLTLNPMRHLDPIGTMALLFFGFGWARPVPVNFRNLQRLRQDMILVSTAGPGANFAMAILSALLLRSLPGIGEGGAAQMTLVEPLALMAVFSLYINIILGTFNLLPIPPLDGGRILTGLLPPGPAAVLARIEPFGFLLVIFLIFFTDLWQLVLAPAIFFLVNLLAGPEMYRVDQTMQFLLGR